MWATHDAPFPVGLFAWEIQRDGEHVYIGERARQLATPRFEVSPIYGTESKARQGINIMRKLGKTRRKEGEGDAQWRLKPTPTCGAMLDSRNVSSMASYNAGLVRFGV
jgi:hypothetical protein